MADAYATPVLMTPLTTGKPTPRGGHFSSATSQSPAKSLFLKEIFYRPVWINSLP